MNRSEQNMATEPGRPRLVSNQGNPEISKKTVGQAAPTEAELKRFLVIRNGRGIIADGDDMAELERNYEAAEGAATDATGRGRAGWLVHSWPAFAALARCDHEGVTGKVCIVDSVDAPDVVTSYYGVGFVE